MSVTAWIAVAGGLLLLAALTSGWVRRLPITMFWIFLAGGLLLGPWALDVWRFELWKHAPWMAAVSELCLVVSLFVAGLKLRLPFSSRNWRVAVRLALPGMVLCIAGAAVAMHVLFGIGGALALMCAAVVAPTDPVLASIISVDDAADRDALRFSLSGEAGLNDGAALPFLVLGLAWLDQGFAPTAAQLGAWLLHELAWSLPAGLAIGGLLGWLLGMLGARVRTVTNETAPSDFLALAIVMVTFAAAHGLGASTFLAAFAAGIGLRRAELQIVSRHPYRNADDEPHGDEGAVHPPAELLIERNRLSPKKQVEPAESIGLVVSDALSFGDTLERLIAVALVFVAGVAFARYWSAPAAIFVIILFVVIRPVSVYLATAWSGLPRPRRWLMGWLGVRGVGTLNYLVYALYHGAQGAETRWLAEVAVTAVVFSVVLHGATVQPLMAWRGRRLAARRDAKPG